MTPRTLKSLFLCGVILVLQPVQAQEAIPHFRSMTNLVLVDVRVLDQEGEPVQGLKADDFSILEEGVALPISYFMEIDVPGLEERLPVDKGLTAIAGSAVQSVPDVPFPEKRLFVFLFDLSSAGLQDISMMERSALEFLEEEFKLYDSAAVLMMDNGLELLTDFTSDPILLGQAFRRLTTGDPEAETSVSAEDGESTSEFVADEMEFALFQTNQQLSAIRSVAEAFREVPGRKALLYFSSGLRIRGIENDEELRWTSDACNRANMSIYSVDARGLVALSPGGGAHRAGGRSTDIFSGRASLNQMASLVESQNTLITLSAETGGAALVDDNDFSKLLRRAAKESSRYYLLGYYSPQSSSDGRFRRVEVRTRVNFGEVISRQGYYAEKPYRALTRSERELNFLQAVVDDLPATELPLTLSAEYFPDLLDQYHVAILLGFDYDLLTRITEGEDLNLEIVIVARDWEGRARGAVRDSLEVRARDEREETRFVYVNLLVLDPGEYQISAYVRDNSMGKMSKTVHALTLPPDASVRLSSLVVAGKWEEAGNQAGYRIKSGKQLAILDDPFRVAGRSLVPRISGAFDASETVYVHGKIRVLDQEADLHYRIVLSNEDGERLFEGSWKELAPSFGELLNINARLPLVQLAPGRYRIAAELSTSDSELHEMSRIFTVLSEPLAGR